MARARPNYIWRKASTGSWWSANESRLQEQTRGTHAVIERPGRARLLIENFCPTRRGAEQLQRLFGGRIVALPPDWEAKAFASARVKPTQIGSRLTIASDEDFAGPKKVLIIPAGAAFGTGGHATTAMSLRLLERVTRPLKPDWRMFDAGTGSGILALAGSCFGAGEVVAIDNDPLAVSTANANARRNHLLGVNFMVADVQRKPRGSFDIITANLYSELLIDVLPLWRSVLRSQGKLILSGVMRGQKRAVVKALRVNGYCVDETRRRGKWIALLCRRGPTR